jgi:hypothetical protein
MCTSALNLLDVKHGNALERSRAQGNPSPPVDRYSELLAGILYLAKNID